MADLTNLTLAEARKGLEKKEFSALDLTNASLQAIERAGALNAVITLCAERALKMAERAQEKINKGDGGALEGIPIGVKDLFCTEGIASGACSNILEGFVPPYESSVTNNLWQAGSVMLGKLNMDEFAMGSSNETSKYGAVVNPWKAKNSDKELVPGGSSGGSAAFVAARLGYGATASDTGGSIRQPAALTGTIGMKPSYGRCSRWGMIAFASSLDQAGPITNTVRDSAILLTSMAGHDPKDTTSINCPVPDYEAMLGKNVKGMKIGIPKEYRMEGVPEEINALWEKGMEWFKEQGAEIIEVSLPHTKYALPAYYIVAPAEASSNLARYDGVRYGLRVEGKSLEEMYQNTRAAGFGDEVRRRVFMGTYVLSAGYYDAYYVKAQKIRRLIANDFHSVFKKVDVLLTPTTPNAAFALGEKMDDPLSMYINDIFTVPANMSGIPAISVPAGLDKQGLPLGLQLMAPAFGEEVLFQTAYALEEAAGFQHRPNPWWLS